MEQPKHNYVKDKEQQALSPKKLFLLIGIPATIGILAIGANELFSYFETAKKQTLASTSTISQPTNNKNSNSPKGVNYYTDVIKPYIDGLRDKLSEGKFEELDKIAESLRASKETFPGGTWKLDVFYDAMSSLNKQGNDEFWEINIKTLETWIKERPNSITAYVALGNLWEQYAWKARGTGYASEVSEENFRLFNERLKKAEEVLNKAKQLPAKCPFWYEVMLSVAHSTGWDKERYEALFEEAIKTEPYLSTFYTFKVIYLLPQWYGEKGDIEKFAEQTYHRFPNKQGAILYQEIADEMNRHYPKDFFRVTTISWDKMKEGYLAREQTYGTNSRILNRFCQLAILAGDKETAKELFQKIDDKWDTSVWKTYKDFEQAKMMVNK